MKIRTTKDECDWGIAQFEVFFYLIEEVKWEYSTSKLRSGFEAAPSALSKKSNLIEKISKVHELHKSGVLTRSEFDAQKKTITQT